MRFLFCNDGLLDHVTSKLIILEMIIYYKSPVNNIVINFENKKLVILWTVFCIFRVFINYWYQKGTDWDFKTNEKMFKMVKQAYIH